MSDSSRDEIAALIDLAVERKVARLRVGEIEIVMSPMAFGAVGPAMEPLDPKEAERRRKEHEEKIRYWSAGR